MTVEFRNDDIVILEDGTRWLVTDIASEDDLVRGVAFGEGKLESRIFPRWQIVGVID